MNQKNVNEKGHPSASSRRPESRTGKFWTFVWTTACLVGFVGHIYFTSMLFFGSNRTESTNIVYPLYVTPPDVSFCFDVMKSVRHDLPPNHGEGGPNSWAIQGGEYLRSRVSLFSEHTVEEIIAMTYHFTDLVESVEVLSTDPDVNNFTLYEKTTNQNVTNSLHRFENVSVKYFLKSFNKCFRITVFADDSMSTPTYYTSDLKRNNPMSTYIKIIFNKELLDSLGFDKIYTYFHRRNKWPRSDDRMRPLVTCGEYFITYATFIKAYKFEPYFRSPCKNYSSIGFDSQKHCQAKCLTDKFMSESKGLPSDIVVLASNTKIASNRTYFSKELCTRGNCLLPDCFRATYTSRIEGQNRNTTVFTMSIGFHGIETKTIVSPKLTLEEYLLFLFTAFGIWFGYSILVILQNITLFLSSVCSWFLRKMTPN